MPISLDELEAAYERGREAYSQLPDAQFGVRTFVKNPESRDHEKTQVLPSPPNSRSKPVGKPQYNVPSGSDDALDGKPLSTERVRTLGKPGEQSPHPNEPVRVSPQRRPGLTAAVTGPQYPGADKQHEQAGKAKRYYQKYYQKNKNRIKNRAKKWIKKREQSSGYKRDKERRETHPEKFERKSPTYRDPAQRSKDWRAEQKHKEAAAVGALNVPFVHMRTGQEMTLIRVTDEFVYAMLGEDLHRYPLEFLFNRVQFLNEADVDRVYAELDAVLGDGDVAVKVATRWADFLYEKRPPAMEVGQVFDRATPPSRAPERSRGHDLDTGYVWNNPGSARVIPEGHDFENRKAFNYRVATRISEIVSHCGPAVSSKATSLAPKLRRVDTKNLVWRFTVPASKGEPYTVRVKAVPVAKNLRDVGKMDVLVSCSCPFFRWQGPEHWAQTNGYLYGAPVGTASKPVVKDPTEKHWVCKHAYAVLKQVESYAIQYPKMPTLQGKTASALRLLADKLTLGGCCVRQVGYRPHIEDF